MFNLTTSSLAKIFFTGTEVENGGQMFTFNIEILKKSFPNDVQTKGSHRVAGIRRTPLAEGVDHNYTETLR